MANHTLFASSPRHLPRADTVNRAGGVAYAYGPEARLAQLAATGTLAPGAYAGAEAQLADVLAAARDVSPDFVAKAAIYARQSGAMKDMPALLAAWMTVAEPDLAVHLFRRVIDNGRMLRTFVQIIRSGRIGRRSLGTRPKRLVQQWLEQASIPQLMQAATGNSPSLADIVKMVHPAPADAARRAFYGWLIGKPYDAAALPAEIAAFEAWKRAPTGDLPAVPFEWLTSFPLSPRQWGVLAGRMGWQALRMNLNTLARHGAFTVKGVADTVAARLADTKALAHARVMPYQLMVALGQVGEDVPPAVQAALDHALEASLARVPKLKGRIVVCPDVSGSMHSPATGYRKGGSSKVRCIDIAALVAAAVLRHNRQARVIPFKQAVLSLPLDPCARVATNAAILAAAGGGGTNVSAPLALLNKERAMVDMVVIISDNESWIDPARRGATAVMAEWHRLKTRNPGAKLVCIDIQPYGTTQAPDSQGPQADIMNVGGFTDAVFDTMAYFVQGETRNWVDIINATDI